MQRRSQGAARARQGRRTGCGLHLAAVGQADYRRRIVPLPSCARRTQAMPRHHRDGGDQRKDDAGDGPVEDGRTDGGMPGPARVTSMRERGDAGEQVAVGETVT